MLIAKRISVSMLIAVAVKNSESADRPSIALYKEYVSNADNISLSAKIILLALLSIPKFITKSIIHPMLNVYIKKIQTV